MRSVLVGISRGLILGRFAAAFAALSILSLPRIPV